MIYALLSMIALAVVLVVLMFICWTPDNIISFLGLLISGGLSVVNLIVIVSFVFIAFVFKIDNVPQAMKYTLVAVAGVLVVISVIIALNPLRWSQGHIRNNTLKLTPIGTSMENVVKIIESKEKWKIDNINYERGYRRPGTPNPADAALGRETIVGEKSIRVLIGEYRNIFTTSVTVFWGFDENGKLIDVYVWKDKDSF